MFTLKIETGNDAMRTGDEIAEALREVASRISDTDSDGTIFDYNGNVVGSYEFLVPCAGGCGRMMDPEILTENATDCCEDCAGTERDPDPWARDPGACEQS